MARSTKKSTAAEVKDTAVKAAEVKAAETVTTEAKKPVEKKDPEEENLLHLSQNIGEFINKKLLIKEDNY